MPQDLRHDAGVLVIGGGLAGSEAAWQLARRGIPVTLVEMRPSVSTPAHHTARLAELVCSNSFKSDDPNMASGALKRELGVLDSLLLRVARETAVPAGGALAVDRDLFAAMVEERLAEEPLVTIVRAEAGDIPSDRPVIVATGPLTSPGLEPALSAAVGHDRMHFFDAAAPIIDSSSIEHGVVFAQSRYGKGGGADYLNCPMDRDEYERFLDALLEAELVTRKEFETDELFQACQPIEEIARRGRDAPRFGPMKPVGLTDPRTDRRPWAVVQLRPENAEGTAHNLVGFQTNLTFAEQRRVFRLIPGLEHAEFLRYGVMHRNTFVDAPRLLSSGLALRARPMVHLAGQLCGTEGYLEAVASGLIAALDVYAGITGTADIELPRTSVLGALIAYATDPGTEDYQPMHVNFGLMPQLLPPVKGKRERYAAYAERGLRDLQAWVGSRPELRIGKT